MTEDITPNQADNIENNSQENLKPIQESNEDAITETSSADKEVVSSSSSSNVVQTLIQDIKTELQKVLVGMDSTIEDSLAALLTNGHVLFEGYPGVAKTLLVKLIAKTLTVDFKRIQFTPDLMPSDVIGTMVFNQNASTFEYKKGPIFSNLVLIDEINRAPAKTQAALFEVMEERQVTVEGNTHPLAPPFFVIGTQNPIDQEGTYRLPEAQLDRFMFKVKVPYPSLEEEAAILDRFKEDFDTQASEELVKPVLGNAQLAACEKFIQGVHISEQIIQYITKLTVATRDHESIYLGASPRASLAILRASKAFAAIAGRDYVTPDDIQRACYPVLNHRLIVSATAEMEGYTSEDIIQSIIEDIEVPR
jgi:MoxR-like ATPase